MDDLTLTIYYMLTILLVEAGVIATIIFRIWYRKYNRNIGKYYSCRMCTWDGQMFRQKQEVLVAVSKETFSFEDGTYTIDSKKAIMRDPAPILVYLIGDSLPRDVTTLKNKTQPETEVDAHAVDLIVERKEVEQTLHAAHGNFSLGAFLYIVSFIGGVVFMYVVLYASHALKT